MFGFFIPVMMDMKNWRNYIAPVVMAGVILVSVSHWVSFLSLSLGFDFSPINYFFPNPPQQWYYNRLIIIPEIMVLGGVAAGLLVWRRNFIPLFAAALFAGFTGFFVFSSIDHFEPRHLSAAHLWYIILIAVGIYAVWTFLQTFTFFTKGPVKYIAGLALVVLSVNGQQILLPAVSHEPYMPITGHYHPELGQLHQFLLANSQKEDVLISTNTYSWYVDWMGQPGFAEKYFVGIDTPLKDILDLIARNHSGWIVLDRVWIDQFAFSPLESFPKNETIEYIGLFGDEYLWHWKTK
jgi:hypothetical protein